MEFANNVKKRETEKELEIEGRTFVIKKFDPLLGNYVALQVVTFILPFGLGDMLNKQMGKGTESSSAIPTAGSSNAKMMGKAEFLELQRDILSVCYERLPGGLTPVVRENGTYGISDFTSTIALQLLIGSIAFNLSDFFVGAGSIGELTEDSGSTFVSM
nr:MAG TPA: tail assembly chaperone protein [Caudoviricetes sp.]